MTTSGTTDLAVGTLTVPDLLRRSSEANGGRTAIVDGPSGGSVNYHELTERVDTIAGWLGDNGVAPGSCVATWAPNVPPVAAFTFAALQVGASVTGINPASTDAEVRRQLRDANVSAVLTTPDRGDRVQRLGVPTVLVVGDTGSGSPLKEVLAQPCRAPDVSVDTDAVALLPYSSGTTGVPKGVMLSHRNVVAVIHQLQQRLQVRNRDVTLAVAPFFHILGMTAELLVPLAAGATVVTTPRFEPIEFLQLLERHRVSYIAVPPPVASFLATHPAVADHDLSALELLASGGAPLSAALQERLAERLPRCAVGQGWGLTETSGAVGVPERGAGAPPGTVGRPLPATEVRVMDTETGKPVRVGADGELEVRGPQVMQGYLGRLAETQAMIRPDGWLRTGDLGHLDPDGNVVIVDRIKELIKVKGFQVAPAEIEQELVSHPTVADAAVTSRPDDRSGEQPVAFVVPRTDTSVAELRAWLRQRLAPYKQPAEIHIVDAVPRTPSGKLLRRALEFD